MLDEWKFGDSIPGRCINIDWLEVYCTENLQAFPMNAQYYRNKGYDVREREYGTRQYREMFVVLDHWGESFIEVRRCPVSSTSDAGELGIFDPYSCHIRLSNRYCYHPQAIDVLSDFLREHGYIVNHIFRLDLCLDFERFDTNDEPQRFVERYMRGRYSKLNQGNVSAYGKDRWNGRVWNSLSWGAPSSMVSTKLYCKTLELVERKDKPYIRYAWFAAGLVDDWQHLSKFAPDGSTYTPAIYRLEFSIRSKARHWLCIEDNSGAKTKRVVKPHDLGCYRTKIQQLEAFAMLTWHYFHFKYYEEGVRKDRCRDKVLFQFNIDHYPYTLGRLMSEHPQQAPQASLLRRLREFRLAHPETDIREACNILIAAIEQLQLSSDMPNPYDRSELALLRRVIAERVKQCPKEPLQQTLGKLTHLFQIQNELFF